MKINVRVLRKFVVQYLRLNGLKVLKMSKDQVGKDAATYNCSCGKKLNVLRNFIQFPFNDRVVLFYGAVCEMCREVYLHDSIKFTEGSELLEVQEHSDSEL